MMFSAGFWPAYLHPRAVWNFISNWIVPSPPPIPPLLTWQTRPESNPRAVLRGWFWGQWLAEEPQRKENVWILCSQGADRKPKAKKSLKKVYSHDLSGWLIVCVKQTTKRLHWVDEKLSFHHHFMDVLLVCTVSTPELINPEKWSITFNFLPSSCNVMDPEKVLYLGKYHQQLLPNPNSSLLYMQDCKTFSRKTNLSIVCSSVGWTSCLALVRAPKFKSYCWGSDSVCSLVTGYCWQQGWKTVNFTANESKWSVYQSYKKFKKKGHAMEAITAEHTYRPDKEMKIYIHSLVK